MSQKDIGAIIRQGRGRMPAFTNLPDKYVTALVHFLVGIEDKEEMASLGGRAAREIPLLGLRKISMTRMDIPPWCRPGAL